VDTPVPLHFHVNGSPGKRSIRIRNELIVARFLFCAEQLSFIQNA
jgi:hypothetical protein